MAVRIESDNSAIVVVDGDTARSSELGYTHYTIVKRREAPFIISATNDSLTKIIQVKSKDSFGYWLNLNPFPFLGIGFLIDRDKDKRYGFPKRIFINMEEDGSDYYTFRPVKNSFDPYQDIIKLSPLKLIDPINPSVELSWEHRTGMRFSTQFMASVILPRSVWDLADGYNPHRKGFRLALEERYYIFKSAPNGLYTAFEINYLNTEYYSQDFFGEGPDYYDSLEVDNSYLDEFEIKKKTLSMNLKLGYQTIFNRFVLDFNFGFGGRYRDVRHYDRLFPEDEFTVPRHPNIEHMANREGHFWIPNVVVGLRLGWRF